MLTTANIFTDYPDIVTVDELTKMLHIGKNKAYELINSKVIQSIRIGRKHCIPKLNVIAYMNRINIEN